MATTIRELLVSIGIKADARGLKKFDARLDAAKRNLGGLARFATLATVAVIGIGAGMLKIASDTAKFGDDMAKMGKRLSLTSEQVQELGFAAGISGAGFADVELGFRRMSKVAADAQRGLSTSVDAFEALGVAFEEAPGQLKKPLALFLDLAQAISEQTDETKQAALAQEVFGRGGTRLLPMLREGKAGIKALMKEAQALGIVMSDESAVAAEEFTDSLLRAKSIMTGLRNTIGNELIPRLTEMLDNFRDWVGVNRDWIRQQIDQKVALITRQFERMLVIGKRVNEFVQIKVGGWGRIFKAVGAALAVAGIVKILVAVNSLVQLGIALWPLLGALATATGSAAAGAFTVAGGAVAAVLLAIPLLLLLLDDLIVLFKGGDSVIGRFVARFGDIEALMKSVGQITKSTTRAWDAFGDSISAVLDLIVAILPSLEVLRPLIDGMFDGFLGSKADEIVKFFEGIGIIIEGWALIFERLVPQIERLTAAVPAGGISSPTLSGLAMSRLAPVSIGGGAGAGPVNRSRNVSQTIQIDVRSTDPVGAAREIEAAMERQHRRARAALAGGEL